LFCNIGLKLAQDFLSKKKTNTMDKNTNPEESNQTSKNYKDLTEESSRHSHNEETTAARFAESDDVNEETTQGSVSKPDGDEWAENKLSTSLDDE